MKAIPKGILTLLVHLHDLSYRLLQGLRCMQWDWCPFVENGSAGYENGTPSNDGLGAKFVLK